MNHNKEYKGEEGTFMSFGENWYLKYKKRTPGRVTFLLMDDVDGL